MIRLTWRQQRGQALAALAALGALAVYVVLLGLSIRHAYDHEIAGCASRAGCTAARIHFHDTYNTRLILLSCLVLVIPGVIGVFWGAPLVARELEAGTHRLVWTQSVTRRRWLAAKVGLVGLWSVTVAGAASLLVTWAAFPFDRVNSRFGALAFDAHDIAPLGYAAFAFTLGVVVGLLTRRTLMAMAITLTIFVGVQVAMALSIRPHLMAPVVATQTFNKTTIGAHQLLFDFNGSANGDIKYIGFDRPGAWVVSTGPLVTRNGQPANLGPCFKRPRGEADLLHCVTARHVRWTTRYQPPGRFWSFQWIELAIFAAGAAGLALFGFWRIPRVAV